MFAGGCGSQKSADGKVVLQFWQFWTDADTRPVMARLLEKFEQENPDIDVAMTELTWNDGHEKIVVAFTSGTEPDVLELGSDWVPEFSSQGVLAEVTDEAAALREDYLLWDPVLYQDKVYGFPWTLDSRAMFYNRELMRRAGLDPDRPPETWPELLRAVQAIDALDEQTYGFGANSGERHRLYKKFLPFLWSNDGKILSDDWQRCLLDRPESVQALEFYLKLTRHGMVETQKMLDRAFMAGQIGFWQSGGWLISLIGKEAPDLDYGVALVPRPSRERGESRSFAGGEYLVISKRSKQRDAALRLIRFLISPEHALELTKAHKGATPAARSAFDDPYFANDPRLSVFNKQLLTSVMPPMHPKWVYMEEAIERAVEKAMYGKASAAEALQEATEKINELLEF
jgi:multiple sugar transport system substrate-binding protein